MILYFTTPDRATFNEVINNLSSHNLKVIYDNRNETGDPIPWLEENKWIIGQYYAYLRK